MPDWIQRADSEAEFAKFKGTKLTVLGFDDAIGWQENLATSVAENFFGAIHAGKLEVDIDGRYVLNKNSIAVFFADKEILKAIGKQKNEPEQFENCRRYLATLQDSPEVIIEESEMLHLGLCQLRILLDEGLPKKVCALRNGMFISDSLSIPGLKGFSDFKEFVAVVECKTKKGIELLRAMEPPRHDDFEPDRLPTKEEQKKGEKALKQLASWIRDMLKRHAKNPVSEVTTLDELKEYFADDSAKDSGSGDEEIDPFGKIIIRAKPYRPKTEPKQPPSPGGIGGGGQSGVADGKGGGAGGGNPPGGGVGPDGGGSGGFSHANVAINNIRAIVSSKSTRRISFTPTTSGKVALVVMEAGADADYDLSIVSSDSGSIDNGKVLIDVEANKRTVLTIGLSDDFEGALKVVAHEI